jgi:hypothetical protein
MNATREEALFCVGGTTGGRGVPTNLPRLGSGFHWLRAKQNRTWKPSQREVKARQDEAKARARSELNEQVALSNAAVAVTQRQQAEMAVQRMQIQRPRTDKFSQKPSVAIRGRTSVAFIERVVSSVGRIGVR